MHVHICKDSLLLEAERLSRDGSIILTYVNSNSRYVAMVLNWLVALDRIGVNNALVVALDKKIYQFLRDRGFATTLIQTNNQLKNIWIVRVQVSKLLIAHGFSAIQSDADAVWLRDPRQDFFADHSASIIVSQGTYWPDKAYRTWGFVLCNGLIAMRADAAVKTFIDRWLVDLNDTEDDQESLNRLLVADNMVWNTAAAVRQMRRFRNRNFITFDTPIQGDCARTGLRLRLLPHDLFQRVPVVVSDPYVVHYLPGLARRPETQALTETGSWFLANNWHKVAFDRDSLQRISTLGDSPRTVEPVEWRRPTIIRVGQ